MSAISWLSGPPAFADGRIPVSVFNVPPGNATYVRFLGQPHVCELHWCGPRSLPHTAPDCPLCEGNTPRVLVGYAPAQRWTVAEDGKQDWLTVAVALTEEALYDLRERELRGTVWALRRADRRARSRLHATYHETSRVPPPDPFDVRPVLERMWRGYLATIKRPVVSAAAPVVVAAPPASVPGPEHDQGEDIVFDANLDAAWRAAEKGGAK